MNMPFGSSKSHKNFNFQNFNLMQFTFKNFEITVCVCLEIIQANYQTVRILFTKSAYLIYFKKPLLRGLVFSYVRKAKAPPNKQRNVVLTHAFSFSLLG